MINPNHYLVAIPSYKRSEIISNNTLRVLQEKGIDPIRINVFVADKEEKQLYSNKVPRDLYHQIVIGRLGLRNQRNFITDYYPENTCLVEFDDDLREISYLQPGQGESRVEKLKNNKLLPILNLDLFIKEAFFRLFTNNTSLTLPVKTSKQGVKEKPKCYLWGVYPVDNAYFLVNKITSDLQFLVGPMWGKINRHLPELKLTLDEKEDFERTLRHYQLDGGVLRFWNVTMETSYYKTPGGMQAEAKDRYLEAEKSANYLVKTFPNYVTKWYKGKTKRPEVRLKDRS